MLIIRRTLAEGRTVGLLSGLGAASADAVYGAIAALGLSALTAFLTDPTLLVLLRLIGGLFLLYLGYKTFISRPAENAATASNRRGLWGAYLSVFALTITNPVTILSFIAIFAGLGAAGEGGALGGLVTVLGVFVGSALWWLLLSGGVSLLRGRFTPRWMLWVNRLSGGILLAFAVTMLWGVLFG